MMEAKTPAGLLAQYIKEQLPQLVATEAKNIKSQIRVPVDGVDGDAGVGIADINFNDNKINIVLTDGREYKKKLPLKELSKSLSKDIATIKEELIVWAKSNLKGKDGRNGKDGTDGNGIRNITIDSQGHLIIDTDNKEYDLGLLRKSSKVIRTGGSSNVNNEYTYTNTLPMPNDVGGLPAGTTFNHILLTDLLNGLLYSYSKPAFTSFVIQEASLIYEVGDYIPEGEAQTEWVITSPAMVEPDSIKIVLINEEQVIAENLPNISPVNLNYPAVTFNVPTDCIFRISATNTNTELFSRDFVIKFLNRIFVGESDLEELTENDVEALRISQLKTDINGTYSMLGGGYKWFCYPQSMGTRLNFFDLSTGFEVAMNDDPITLVLTNAFGLEIPYYCYRSIYILHGASQIEVRP